MAQFYSRVAGTHWDDVRALINDWASRLDPETRADVAARLRSPVRHNFWSAFLELYLHETLLRSGYDVTCHPSMPEGARRPDFLATKGDQSFYLEARDISGAGVDEAASNRVSSLYDALNKMTNLDYWLWIAVDNVGPASLGAKRLRTKLDRWLAGLDFEEMSELVRSGRLEDMPTHRLEQDGWVISLRPIPKSAQARGVQAKHRILGIFGGTRAEFVDDVTPIRDALSDKGKAYGTLDLPYIIALGISSFSSDDDDVIAALYGSEHFLIDPSIEGDEAAKAVRARDGYWYRGDHWAHRSVSGVLVARNVHPSMVASHVSTLWLHPDPERPVRPLPVWRSAHVRDGAMVREDAAVDPRSFFGLPDPWPTKEAFPC